MHLQRTVRQHPITGLFMKNLSYIFFVLLISGSLSFFSIQAASDSNPAYGGVHVGLVLDVGNRYLRTGLQVNSYYCINRFQLHGGMRYYVNLLNPGPKKRYTEAVFSLGTTVGWEFNALRNNPFVDLYSNNTRYQNSFSYSYNCYVNKIGTTQQTGIISLQLNRFSLVIENDILARPELDRFRTGAFLLEYQEGEIKWAINNTLWTGHFKNRKKNADSLHFPSGYMDTTFALYAHASHGMLSLQGTFILPYQQYARINLGIDAEPVRNVIQNKLIHDACFLPKKWRKSKNAHIPMVDEKGQQYLFRETQKIKSAAFYYNFFLNPMGFY